MSDYFTVYSVGLCYISVCASKELTPDAVERRANDEHPTGVSHPWSIDKKGEFRDGSPNPTPCDTNPETHRHYLLSC